LSSLELRLTRARKFSFWLSHAVVQSVTRNVTHVVSGGKPGDSKSMKAMAMGIKTISEDELLEMIKDRSITSKMMAAHVSVVRAPPVVETPVYSSSPTTSSTTKIPFITSTPYTSYAHTKPKVHIKIKKYTRHPLAGHKFVISGVLKAIPNRDQAIQFIKLCGAEVVQGISKKVTHLVVADKPGHAKIEDAKRNGVTIIINEAQLIEMITNRDYDPYWPLPILDD
jgi:NAD-dependent DNA ligase